jgi:phosphatidylglycerophosphatase A
VTCAVPLIGAFLGGWEVILIVAVVAVVFLAMDICGGGDFWRGLSRGIREFRRSVDEVNDELRSAASTTPREHRDDRWSALILFVAQGFGSGRAPFSPGTFGSVVGLLWVALLISTNNFWIYLAASIEAVALSIWLCNEAEEILGRTDPGSVVLDEIVALPFCFLPWVFAEWLSRDTMPPLEFFYSGRGLLFTALTFGLFRLFDIWKPWPIRQLQHLPGGWGVTVDDLLAAVYVAACSLLWVA